MKRFSRSPSFEELEEKRLKAADVLQNLSSHGAAVEAAAPSSPTTAHVTTSKLQSDKASTSSRVAEDAGDDSESNHTENKTDDTDETGDTDQTDGSDDNKTDDDNETNDSTDNESDNTESDDNDNSDTKTELSANLTATTGNSVTKATAEFESKSDDGTAEQEFSLKVSGLMSPSGTPVNGTQPVRIGGNSVGMISLTNGSGKLELSSNGEDGAMPSPDGFPTTVDSTTTVEVGPAGTPILTGTFGTSSSDSENLTALNSIQVSSAQASKGLLAISSGSSAVIRQASSNSLAASSAEAQNVDKSNAADQNLLDAGFSATEHPSGSTAQEVFLRTTGADQSDATNAASVDAALESLAPGDLSFAV